MASLIKTITDKGQFEAVFYKYFMNNEAFLRTKSGNLKITFFGYSEGLVAFKIPFLKHMFENCLVYTRKNEFVIYASLKIAEKQEENLYLFFPIKLQIISSARKEDRQSIDAAGSGKKILYVSRLISDFIIENSLAMSLKQVDRVKEIIRFDLEKYFQHLKIYLMNEGMSDVRMKHFRDHITPLFIPSINDTKNPKYEKVTRFYINEIYARDYFLKNRQQFISEIAVPVLYRAKIPYGYVQVNNTTPFTESALTVIKRSAIIIEELFTKEKVFPQTEERLLVSDVSKRGIGIVFKERRFVRYFKEGSLVFFDLILPDKKKASVLATVRHIALMENKIIKVGCEIKELDAISEAHYDEFLQSAGSTG
jgi:hypothetical protein